jgi:hypothetical protein
MKEIKNFTKKLFIIIIILIILDFTIGSVLQVFYFSKRSLSTEENKLYYSLNKTNEDILIFGSSTAYHGYIPEIFQDSLEKSCYNVGQNLMNIYFHYALLKSTLHRYVPKVIILDLTAWDFVKSKDDFEILSELYPFYFSNGDVKEIVDVSGKTIKIKMLSKLYRYNSKLLFILKHNINISNRKQMGFIPLFGIWNNDIVRDTSNGYLNDQFKFSFLDHFISNATEMGSKVIVVASPSFEIFTKNQFEELERYLRKKKIDFWNFRNDTSFINHREYFYNVTHLNNTGAEKFTKKIVERLKSEQFAKN